MLETRHFTKINQYALSIILVLGASGVSYLFKDIIEYRAVGLILLLAVSIAAMLFDIIPVLISALLSALIFNFFFIPPIFTFHIQTAEDVLMFAMYFIIAMINGVLTIKIRQFESKKRDEEEKEKTIELYNTLLNSLSHELRTPISTVIGAIDTIVDSGEKLSETNKMDLYSEIASAGNRLNRQVENLLSMSRLEAGILKPTFDWFDINELIFNVINEIDLIEDRQRIIFKPNEQLKLMQLDGGFLEMSIHNLLYNAIQHTSKSTTVVVSAECSNNVLLIDISDNGKGFPKDEIEFVFDKFYKINGTGTGGTGLGLSIAKGFIEAMNGKIRLQNKNTGGAHFSISIPVTVSAINIPENE